MALLLFLASCGFQLRGEAEAGVHKLFISSVGPSQVQADIKRLLATGPTSVVATAKEAEAHLHILQESREKTVYTITGTGSVYEFQLRLIVRYEVLAPGREDPVVPPTTVETRRLITYSINAPTAKETEEQLLFKDMQLDLAGQILRHVAAVKRDITQ
ncbi:MAG TPA: LPS assembly lipoprotein LptE [Usitatibacter sp.]|nr:LPS assembly lipoprotein LptE [Usitatibacter sp.]